MRRLTVFISSTADLKSERDAVGYALLELDIDGSRFESWPSTPNPPIYECLQQIEESDAVVVLLGKHYGTLTDPGISITHLEYRRAIELNKPVFVFLLNVRKREPEQIKFIKEVKKSLFHCQAVKNVEELKIQVKRSLQQEFIRRFHQAIKDIDETKERKSKHRKTSIPQGWQVINGNRNIQAGRDVNISVPKAPKIEIMPPRGSIGEDPLLKNAIITWFNQIGEQREKRFGKKGYEVMYSNFKKDFGIKHNPWTIIWTWPRECAQEIINYLDEKFANTIQGRIERAASREGYISTRPHLYKEEKELLAHFGLNLDSPQVKDLLSQYFGVSSHAKLSHLQHWQWVCYLKDQVKKLEEQ